VLPRTYDNQVCSIARALEAIGDRWTMLVIRDAFMGVRRFEDLQTDLGIARNVLSDRLTRLVEDEILERRPYQAHPPRYEYVLTAKGMALWPVLVSLMKWGDRFSPAEDGPPARILHRGCGGEVTERLDCERCGEPLAPETMVVERRADLRPAPA
jgi:DNA-binding HxlR family transcriptional regulator